MMNVIHMLWKGVRCGDIKIWYLDGCKHPGLAAMNTSGCNNYVYWHKLLFIIILSTMFIESELPWSITNMTYGHITLEKQPGHDETVQYL